MLKLFYHKRIRKIGFLPCRGTAGGVPSLRAECRKETDIPAFGEGHVTDVTLQSLTPFRYGASDPFPLTWPAPCTNLLTWRAN